MENGALQKLFDILETLRGDEGCPWDRSQKIEDILSDLIEEAYELEWANVTGSPEAVLEEMGDVLFVACFAIALVREKDPAFTLENITSGAYEKIKRRHPHVFGKESARTKEEGLAHWNRMKSEERRDKELDESAVGDVPASFSPIRKAERIQKLAAGVNFDWPDASGVIAKIREEVDELEHGLRENSEDIVREELGDLLFSVVNLCRFLNVDGEQALTQTNAKFSRRFQEMERLIREDSCHLQDLSLDEMDQYWERAKERD
jgi:tetrapyrrole methylase family protein/MazG family protein